MFRRTVRTLQSRIVPVSGRCLRHTYIYMLSLTKARRLSVFSDGALKDSASCGWMRHHGARADRCGALSRRPRSGGGLPMGAGGVLRDGCRGVGPDVARSSRRSTSGSLFGPVSSRRGGGMFQELCGDCCAGFVGPCGGCSPVAVPRRRRFALLRHVPQTGDSVVCCS